MPAGHEALSTQLAGHTELSPPQKYGAHDGLPGEPAGVLAQVPTLPVRLQASQAPAQAVLQHTPSTQLPLTHAFAAAQVAPRGFLGTQAEPLQYWPAAHWLSAVQLVGQPALIPEQANGAHDGLPVEPAGLLAQVPTLPVRLQALQAPAQAVLQHTPSTQLPLTHAFAAVQAAPRAFLGTQAEPLQ